MKYIITDQNECVLGDENTFHHNLACGCRGRVIGAGHYTVDANGALAVYGQSIGYGIKAKPADLDFVIEAAQKCTGCGMAICTCG